MPAGIPATAELIPEMAVSAMSAEAKSASTTLAVRRQPAPRWARPAETITTAAAIRLIAEDARAPIPNVQAPALVNVKQDLKIAMAIVLANVQDGVLARLAAHQPWELIFKFAPIISMILILTVVS